MSSNRQEDHLKIFSETDLSVVKGNNRQLVLQIPNQDNQCERPTLLICSSNSDSVDDYNLITMTLDELLSQVKQNYANDAEALQRFSYYLVLKAKEMST